jgi:hypothetical protein
MSVRNKLPCSSSNKINSRRSELLNGAMQKGRGNRTACCLEDSKFKGFNEE